MKNVITVQHTQSIHHTNDMVGSWTDWDLSELGIEQAHSIGKKLSSELKDNEYVIYCSGLMRAKHTADIISEYFNTVPIVRNELMEQGLGKAVGKSVQWLRENVECRVKTVDDKLFSDAESRRDVYLRLMQFYKEIMENENNNIIIVSHGGTLSMFNVIWMGLDIEFLNKCNFHGQAGSVSFYEEGEDGKHIVKRINDKSFL